MVLDQQKDILIKDKAKEAADDYRLEKARSAGQQWQVQAIFSSYCFFFSSFRNFYILHDMQHTWSQRQNPEPKHLVKILKSACPSVCACVYLSH